MYVVKSRMIEQNEMNHSDFLRDLEEEVLHLYAFMIRNLNKGLHPFATSTDAISI